LTIPWNVNQNFLVDALRQKDTHFSSGSEMTQKTNQAVRLIIVGSAIVVVASQAVDAYKAGKITAFQMFLELGVYATTPTSIIALVPLGIV